MGHRNRVTWASFLLIANNHILFFLHRLVLQAGCEHINNREGGLQVSSRSFFLHHQILIREQPCTMCFCSLQNSSRFVLIANLCLSITIYPPNENIILTPMYELQAFVELEIIPSVQILLLISCSSGTTKRLANGMYVQTKLRWSMESIWDLSTRRR